MNRFIVCLALAAAVLAVSSAPAPGDLSDEVETQAMLSTTNDEETRHVLASDLGVFADFCIQSRDSIFADVKSRTGSMSSQGFSSFFQMAEDVAREAMDANKDATGRFASQLANPSASVEGEDAVAEVQRSMADRSQPMALATAVRGTLAATASAVVNVFAQKVDQMKAFTNIEQVASFAQSGCALVNQYEEQLRQQFATYKAEGLTGELRAKYASLSLDKVPCVTSTRIVRGNGVCGFVKVAFAPVKKMLGYEA